MFAKLELTQAQSNALGIYIGPEGIYTETIFDYDKEDLGTKIIFLQKAIEEDCLKFCESLDRLYYVHERYPGKETNLELVRSLKTINDLCFNNTVKFGDHGLNFALSHFFDRVLGEVNPNTFKEKIRALIKEQIDQLLNEPGKVEKIQ